MDTYHKILKQIHDYFGYVEDWRVIPLDDRLQYRWYLTGEGYGDSVIYAENMDDFKTGEYYLDEIYTQRHLPKWVYRGENFTLVCVDTHTDLNQFIAIYMNALELKENPIT